MLKLKLLAILFLITTSAYSQQMRCVLKIERDTTNVFFDNIVAFKGEIMNYSDKKIEFSKPGSSVNRNHGWNVTIKKGDQEYIFKDNYDLNFSVIESMKIKKKSKHEFIFSLNLKNLMNAETGQANDNTKGFYSIQLRGSSITPSDVYVESNTVQFFIK